MAHTFKVSTKEELKDTLKKVECAIVDQGGKFNGNTDTGGFAGKTVLGEIRGEYCCTENQGEIEITITKKPMIAPYSKIESAIRDYFS